MCKTSMVHGALRNNRREKQIGTRRSLCQAPALSLSPGPTLSVSGPNALCVGAQRSLRRSSPNALCVGARPGGSQRALSVESAGPETARARHRDRQGQSAGPRQRKRWAPTQRAPGPDRQRPTETAGPTQRPPRPDTESFKRGPPGPDIKSAAPRHRERLGLTHIFVLGPSPQLPRVFVCMLSGPSTQIRVSPIQSALIRAGFAGPASTPAGPQLRSTCHPSAAQIRVPHVQSVPPIRRRGPPALIRVPPFGSCGSACQPPSAGRAAPRATHPVPREPSSSAHPARRVPFSRREPQTLLFGGKATMTAMNLMNTILMMFTITFTRLTTIAAQR